MDVETDDSDDDCQLYAKKAEHFIKKRAELQAKRKELEKVIDIIPEVELENALRLNDVNLTNRFAFSNEKYFDTCNVNSDVSVVNVDLSDPEDDIPLAELSRNLRSNKRRRNSQLPVSQRKLKRKSRRRNIREPSRYNTSHVSDLGVIILDDDTGYPADSLPPISFNSRPHKQSRISDERLENISLENIINEDSDEAIGNDDLVTLTIEWNNSHKTTRKEFKLRRYQKFESVFEELAKMENISANQVLLMYDFKSVNPMDTPSSLNLKFYGALIGSVSATEIDRSKVVNVANKNDKESIDKSKGGIQVKLLLQSKQTFFFQVFKHQKMDILYKKCAEELKCEKSKLKLTFDGEYVEPSEHVADLDIEDGDVFHVHPKM